MKVTVNSSLDHNKRAYPYIGQASNGNVVLFVSPKTGVSLKGANPVGMYASSWLEESFSPIVGSVTLAND